MIDIKFIRENPSKVATAAKNKGVDVNIDHVLHLDNEYRKLSTEVQTLQQERNTYAQEKNIEKGKGLKNVLAKKEHDASALRQELKQELYKIPNLAKDDVPPGENETENKVIRTVGEKPTFTFTPKDHLELGEALDIIDVKRAAKVSGTRFAYLKNDAVLLEFALVQFALATLTKEGFIPIVPPVLINKDITEGLGYWQEKGNEEYYYLNDPDEKKEMYLVGTAEHAIVPMHRDEVFDTQELPKRYVAFSSAFRREAGSYGKDTRGILRVHQFDKVEMVSFVSEKDDDKEHEYLLSLEEKLFQALGISYQVVQMCTGDLGFPAARKYDVEAWIPSQNKYREVTSVSTVTDFQSRRLNIKYLENLLAGGEKKFVHILNGTAFAIGRTIIAIMENYQQEDGSITVPEVLRTYVGKDKISSKKV